MNKTVKAIRNWEHASINYMIDCNVRLLKKDDSKRKRLASKCKKSFEDMMEMIRYTPKQQE